MKVDTLRPLLPLLAVGVLLAACGDDGTSPEDLTLADLVGTWTGSTSQGHPLEIQIASGGVTRVELRYEVTGTFCSYDAETEIGFSEPLPISVPDFTVGPFPLSGGTTIRGSGSFESASRVEGDLTITDSDCDGTVQATWTAQKR